MDRNAQCAHGHIVHTLSLSARRAWIEIITTHEPTKDEIVALRKESVDRNTLLWDNNTYGTKSLSARRAWIEISLGGDTEKAAEVALRKESVDRNSHPPGMAVYCRVALRKESVDRNIVEIHPDGRVTWSLSARRAWIEIYHGGRPVLRVWSLSARRAWIEIRLQHFC